LSLRRHIVGGLPASIVGRALDLSGRFVRAGYRPRAAGPSTFEAITRVDGRAATVPPDCLRQMLANRLRDGVAFVLPTMLSRADEVGHGAQVAHLVEQLAGAPEGVSRALIVGLQYGDADPHLAMDRLRVVIESVVTSDVMLVGLALKGPCKSLTLNTCFRLLSGLDLLGIGWLDDDVRLEPGALGALVRRFLAKSGRGAVGAIKVGHKRDNLVARALWHMKHVTQPATNYPHGCCILVESAVVAEGIPARFCSSDDGFVCFSLLDPAAPDPMRLLELVPEARCHHFVGGSAAQTRRRLQRMLTNHQIFMAFFGPEIATYYFQHVLFHGLWPLAPLDTTRGAGHAFARWGLKALYFGWFCGVGVWLAARGLVARPLEQVPWGGVTSSDSPLTHAVEAL